MKSFFTTSLTVVVCLGLFPSVTSAEVAIPDSIGRFLKKHCYRCHGAEVQEADLSLHDMAAPRENTPLANLWTTMLQDAGAAVDRFADADGAISAVWS